MRRRLQARPGTVPLRSAMAADLRSFAAQTVEAGFSASSTLRTAERLEAGEPVVVDGWEVSRYLDGPDAMRVPGFRIEVDGSVTPMRTVHNGSHVWFEPIDGPHPWVPKENIRPLFSIRP